MSRIRSIVALAVVCVGLATNAQAAITTLTGTIRDFRYRGTVGGHPDFEYVIANDAGIVKSILGADGKPEYAPLTTSPTTNGKTFFDQWYNDTPGVNLSQSYAITLSDVGHPGTFTYSNNSFFPIDGQLLGNQSLNHNFHFTYELHNQFTFSPGQVFTFTGDDDLWVYINHQLVINLGGVHGPQSATVNLNALGLTAGNTYDFDLFFAERHTTGSNFSISTSIVLEPVAVPEPVSAVVWSGLLVAMGCGFRRRRAGDFIRRTTVG